MLARTSGDIVLPPDDSGARGGTLRNFLAAAEGIETAGAISAPKGICGGAAFSHPSG